MVLHALNPGFGKVDAIGRELFAMCAQVGGRIANLVTDSLTVYDRAQNSVFATKHFRRSLEIAVFHRLAYGGAADDISVHRHRRDANNGKIEAGAQFFQQIEISRPIFSERPFVADANFAQRFGMLDQSGDKFFRWCCGKVAVEFDNE